MVLCLVQVTNPPRSSGSGFWIGLEPNGIIFPVQTRIAGGLPGPVANSMFNTWLLPAGYSVAITMYMVSLRCEYSWTEANVPYMIQYAWNWDCLNARWFTTSRFKAIHYCNFQMLSLSHYSSITAALQVQVYFPTEFTKLHSSLLFTSLPAPVIWTLESGAMWITPLEGTCSSPSRVLSTLTGECRYWTHFQKW